MTRRPLHACEHTVLRLTPGRLRYAAMVRLACLLAIGRQPTPLDTPRDDALAKLLERAHHYGLRFDLPWRLENDHVLDDALEAGTGVLLVSGHALLGLTIPRFLDDIGLEPAIVGTNASIILHGTGRRAPMVPRTESHSAAVRSALAEHRLVLTWADRASLPPEISVEFETVYGRVRATPKLMAIAVELGAAVVFAMAATDARGHLRLTFAAPSGEPPWSPEGLLADYVAFVQQQTRRGLIRRGARSARRA